MDWIKNMSDFLFLLKTNQTLDSILPRRIIQLTFSSLLLLSRESRQSLKKKLVSVFIDTHLHFVGLRHSFSLLNLNEMKELHHILRSKKNMKLKPFLKWKWIHTGKYLQAWLCERQEVWFVWVLCLTTKTKNPFPAMIATYMKLQLRPTSAPWFKDKRLSYAYAINPLCNWRHMFTILLLLWVCGLTSLRLNELILSKTHPQHSEY